MTPGQAVSGRRSPSMSELNATDDRVAHMEEEIAELGFLRSPLRDSTRRENGGCRRCEISALTRHPSTKLRRRAEYDHPSGC